MASKENSPVNVQAAEAAAVKQIKATHKQTTQSAQRAVRVVASTVEVAQATTVQLHRQGEQLRVVEENLDQLHDEVKEASSLVRFMRRLCCFAVLTSCCSDCTCVDPDVQRDATRSLRVKQMQLRREEAAAEAEAALEAKKAAVDGLVGATKAQRSEAAAVRGELLEGGDKIRARRARAPVRKERVAAWMAEADQEELEAETRVQEECLDQISAAVDTLDVLSKAMREEMVEQAPRMDRLGNRTEVAHDNLQTVQRGAGKLVGRRRRETVESSMGEFERQAEAAATAARYNATRVMA